jgi:hypothetical protein
MGNHWKCPLASIKHLPEADEAAGLVEVEKASAAAART